MCLGVPGQIVEIKDESRDLAIAEISGVRREICYSPILVDQTPASLVGKWALIHVGFAMSEIDEAEAEATLKALAELGEIEEEMRAIAQSEKLLSSASEG